MSEIDRKREGVRKVYEAEGWNVEKVDTMSDTQLIALYLKFQAQGKLR